MSTTTRQQLHQLLLLLVCVLINVCATTANGEFIVTYFGCTNAGDGTAVAVQQVVSSECVQSTPYTSQQISCAGNSIQLFFNTNCNGSPLVTKTIGGCVNQVRYACMSDFALLGPTVTVKTSPSSSCSPEFGGTTTYKTDVCNADGKIYSVANNMVTITAYNTATCTGAVKSTADYSKDTCISQGGGIMYIYLAYNDGTTSSPTPQITNGPTSSPTAKPSMSPVTSLPTSMAPTTLAPSKSPTNLPTVQATKSPTAAPSKSPTRLPTVKITKSPTTAPTKAPSKLPTVKGTSAPIIAPSNAPTTTPTLKPTKSPTTAPSKSPSKFPTTKSPTLVQTKAPTNAPTAKVTKSPTSAPSKSPTTTKPSKLPTSQPTRQPTNVPTFRPSRSPADVFPAQCASASGLNEAACKRRRALCNQSGVFIKWGGSGCTNKQGKRMGDGGCQCKGYCGYTCKNACSKDNECKWAGNKCFVKATGEVGVPIASCV